MRIETMTAAEWQRQLAALPMECQDIYFTAEYHELHAEAPAPDKHAMLMERAGERLLVPGLRFGIATAPDQGAWDLQTCNGYGGPVASAGATEGFIRDAWRAWRDEAAVQGCVAAFFRLHPLIENGRWLPPDAVICPDRATVYVDFVDGLAAAWTRADSRHRNMVSKGRRESVSVEWDRTAAWADFEMLYGEAMERLGAPPTLHFSPEYFARLSRLPGGRLASVYHAGRMEAAACFLFGPQWGHYHLSARRAGGPNHLMNCILQSAFERAAEMGLHGMHLGGGRTNLPDDELLKFKLRTGGRTLAFQVARVIVNREAYDALVSEWRTQAGQEPRWLLGYRQPKPAKV